MIMASDKLNKQSTKMITVISDLKINNKKYKKLQDKKILYKKFNF